MVSCFFFCPQRMTQGRSLTAQGQPTRCGWITSCLGGEVQVPWVPSLEGRSWLSFLCSSLLCLTGGENSGQNPAVAFRGSEGGSGLLSLFAKKTKTEAKGFVPHCVCAFNESKVDHTIMTSSCHVEILSLRG